VSAGRGGEHGRYARRSPLELLAARPERTDVEMATELGIDLKLPRVRLEDLRKRGIVAFPNQSAAGGT
jgi:hypothetical protein